MRPYGFASPHRTKDQEILLTDFPLWIRSARPRSGGLIWYASAVYLLQERWLAWESLSPDVVTRRKP